MNLQDFINKWNSKPLDYDNAYGNQCVDLMNEYMVEVLGIGNPISGYGGNTAYEIYSNHGSDANFTKTNNTPSGVPQSGDIVFWNTSIGSAGHVAVFISGGTANFQSFDQNWPLNSYCHVQSHNYNGVAGWFHPKTAPATNQGDEIMTPDQEKNAYEIVLGREPEAGAPLGQRTAWHFIQDSSVELNAQRQQARDDHAAVIKLTAQLNDITAANKQLSGQVTSLQAQLVTLTKQVTDLQTQLATQTGDSTNLNSLGVLLQWLIKRLGLK